PRSPDLRRRPNRSGLPEPFSGLCECLRCGTVQKRRRRRLRGKSGWDGRRSAARAALSHRISITALGTISTERTNHYDKNSTNNRYTVTNYAPVGGDANLSATAGRVQFSGGIQILNVVTGQKLIFLDIAYDATNHQVDYTLKDATLGPDGVPVGGVPLGLVLPIFNMG